MKSFFVIEENIRDIKLSIHKLATSSSFLQEYEE